METTVRDEMCALRQKIAQLIGENQYKIWFTQAVDIERNEQQILVYSANAFIHNWIESRYQLAIRQAVREVFGFDAPVVFGVRMRSAQAADKAVACNVSAASALPSAKTEPIWTALPANSSNGKSAQTLKLTFDTFVVGAKNQLAYNAAQAILQQPHAPFNPLFVHGGYGVGKTHLLQAVCNALAAKNPAARWRYLSAEQFANEYVIALKTQRLDAFRSRFRNLDLLAIDDVHFFASKSAMQEEFLHTFNSIDLAGKQIILASDAHPKEIGQLCEKLVNRFVSGMVVRMDPPDFPMRLKICAMRAKQMNLSLSEALMRQIAERFSSSVRELEGALIKISAYAALLGRPLTEADLHQMFSEQLPQTDPGVCASDIVTVSAKFFGVSASDLHSDKKERAVSLARAFAMYLTRRLTSMSYPEIGRALGNKNHATVLIACRKVEQMLKTNRTVKWKSASGFRNMAAKDIFDALWQKLA